MKLARMFRHVSAVFAHGQGDTYRSNVWAIIPCLLHIFRIFWRIVMKLWSKVQFIKTLCRRHESALYLKVKVILEGWMFRPVFRVHSIYPTFFEGFSWNVPQMLSLLIRCVEVISQPFLLQVKLRLNVLIQCFMPVLYRPHFFKRIIIKFGSRVQSQWIWL